MARRSRSPAMSAEQNGGQCRSARLCGGASCSQGGFDERGIGFDECPGGMEETTCRSPAEPAIGAEVDGRRLGARSRSHEAIYQSLYIQGRGALRRELTACLRSGRALRVPRERTRGSKKGFVGDAIMISDRPAEIADRAVPGHWEGDLILGWQLRNRHSRGTKYPLH